MNLIDVGAFIGRNKINSINNGSGSGINFSHLTLPANGFNGNWFESKQKFQKNANEFEDPQNDTRINFTNNGIDDNRISDISSNILKNKKVKILDLTSNRITSDGVNFLLKKLAFHPTLERIIFANNNIDESVFKKIEDLSKQFKNIKSINVESNPCTKNLSKAKRTSTALSRINIKLEF